MDALLSSFSRCFNNASSSHPTEIIKSRTLGAHSFVWLFKSGRCYSPLQTCVRCNAVIKRSFFLVVLRAHQRGARGGRNDFTTAGSTPHALRQSTILISSAEE